MIKTLLIGLCIIVATVGSIALLVYLIGIFRIFIHNTFTKKEKYSYKDNYDIVNFGFGGLMAIILTFLMLVMAYMLGSILIH